MLTQFAKYSKTINTKLNIYLKLAELKIHFGLLIFFPSLPRANTLRALATCFTARTIIYANSIIY